MTTQVMTGHGEFSEYLKRFGCKESSSCFCEPTYEPAIHVIAEYPVYSAKRYNTEQILNLELTKKNPNKILKDKENNYTFIDFNSKVATIGKKQIQKLKQSINYL